jgi:hypothetical protein
MSKRFPLTAAGKICMLFTYRDSRAIFSNMFLDLIHENGTFIICADGLVFYSVYFRFNNKFYRTVPLVQNALEISQIF